MDIINELAKIRREQGLTQAELGEMTNLSRGCINNMECGRSRTHHDVVVALADALGYELDLILKH